jgi:hypothetical protein
MKVKLVSFDRTFKLLYFLPTFIIKQTVSYLLENNVLALSAILDYSF